MSESIPYGQGPGRDSENLIKEILQEVGWNVVDTREAAEDGQAPMSDNGGDALRLPDFLAQHHRHSERYVEVKSKREAVHYRIEDEYRHGWEKPQHEDYLEYRELSGRPVYIFVHERKTGVILRQRVRNLPSGQTITDGSMLAAYDTDDPIIVFPVDAFETVTDNIGDYLNGFAQDGLLKDEAELDPFGVDLPGTQATLGDVEKKKAPENGSRIAEIIRTHKSITVPELVREFIADQEMTEEDGAEVVRQLEAEGLVYMVPHNAPPEEQVVKLP